VQWQHLLEHLGAWEGSFTRLDPRGCPLEDTPTLVRLDGLDDNTRIRQTIERLAGDRPTQAMEYGSLNRNTIVFENGAFSTGSSQFGPFSEFGAELGFVAGDRRLRLVPLYDRDARLSSFTLIRERRQGTDAPERPPLTVEQLLGTWRGTISTRFPDLRSPETGESELTVTRAGDRVCQRLQAGQWNSTTTARLEDARLVFAEREPAVQVLLLPDGASCTAPVRIVNRQGFFLEIGWLLDATTRQRLIRRYDDHGTWTSLSLIEEQRVA